MFDELDRLYPSQTHKLARFREEFERVKHLTGDFAEFGVCNGNGSRELAQLDPNRVVYAFDTFAGMPERGYHLWEDADNPPGKWKPSAPPEDLFRGIPNIEIVRGEFRDTLPQVGKLIHFCLVHIDCDWYASYTQVLEFLESRMSTGGIILMDDYRSCNGATRAVDEWTLRVGARATHNGDKIVWNA